MTENKNFVTLTEVATLRGTSIPAVRNALSRGSIIQRDDGLFDLTEPKNAKYIKKKYSDNQKKGIRASAATKAAQKFVEDKLKEEYAEYVFEEELKGEKPLSFINWKSKNYKVQNRKEIGPKLIAEKIKEIEIPDTLEGLEVQQYAEGLDSKDQAEIAQKKERTLNIALKNAEKLGVLVDINTIGILIGEYHNLLNNEVVVLPDSISDKLYQIAVSSDNPVLDINTELKKVTERILKKAKEIVDKITSPPKGIRYIIESVEEKRKD